MVKLLGKVTFDERIRGDNIELTMNVDGWSVIYRGSVVPLIPQNPDRGWKELVLSSRQAVEVYLGEVELQCCEISRDNR